MWWCEYVWYVFCYFFCIDVEKLLIIRNVKNLIVFLLWCFCVWIVCFIDECGSYFIFFWCVCGCVFFVFVYWFVRRFFRRRRVRVRRFFEYVFIFCYCLWVIVFCCCCWWWYFCKCVFGFEFCVVFDVGVV